MFYKTRIKSVTSNGAVDENGRPLSFIGYLPVKAGNTVYTDGRVIFGNAPPKGSPAVFDEPCGIPVLSDFDSSGNELRGYFTSNGRYKKFGIKGDEWIVNGKKKYAHDGEDIIDAEIADDGKILTVEKITQGSGEPNSGVFDKFYAEEGMVYVYDDNVAGLVYDSGGVYNGDTLKDSDFCSDDGGVSRNCNLVIKANGEPIQAIDVYREYIKTYEKLEDERIAKHLKDGLLSYSVSGKNGRVMVTETDIEPLEWHYGTRARIDNFRIFPNGSWFMLLTIVIVNRQKFYTDHFKLEYPAYYTGIFLIDCRSSGRVSELYNSVTTAISYETLSAHFSGSKLGVAYMRDVANSFKMPFQDGFYATINLAEKPPDNIWWKWLPDKIYTANNEIVCDFSNFDSNVENADAHRWNMSIAELKGGQYLFGIHKDKEHEIDGKLYKISSDGQVEQVGNGLKNFRLRELKKISKAKK